MSDTPRTDALEKTWEAWGECPVFPEPQRLNDFARTLERALAAAQKERDEAREWAARFNSDMQKAFRERDALAEALRELVADVEQGADPLDHRNKSGAYAKARAALAAFDKEKRG